MVQHGLLVYTSDNQGSIAYSNGMSGHVDVFLELEALYELAAHGILEFIGCHGVVPKVHMLICCSGSWVRLVLLSATMTAGMSQNPRKTRRTSPAWCIHSKKWGGGGRRRRGTPLVAPLLSATDRATAGQPPPPRPPPLLCPAASALPGLLTAAACEQGRRRGPGGRAPGRDGPAAGGPAPEQRRRRPRPRAPPP